MKIEVEKRNNISLKIEDYVLKRAKKLEKYIKEGSLKCVLSYQKGNFLTEVTLEISKNTFKAHASSNDIKVSINEGLEKIEHQFKKFKERVVDHKKIVPVFEEKSIKKNPIVKIKKIEPILLFIDEAIEEFNNSKEPFFVFINKETNRQSIIHKTKTGDYRVVEC